MAHGKAPPPVLFAGGRRPWFARLPVLFPAPAFGPSSLPAVRAWHARGRKNMEIDGDLAEFKDAFCHAVEYFSSDRKTLRNRAAQFFYMWDDEAFTPACGRG